MNAERLILSRICMGGGTWQDDSREESKRVVCGRIRIISNGARGSGRRSAGWASEKFGLATGMTKV